MPDWLNEMERGSRGIVAALVQVAFVIVNGVIIFGGAMMIRVKLWGLAFAAAILAMINFGNCCCVIGMPIGIWSVIILNMVDVRQAFANNQ